MTKRISNSVVNFAAFAALCFLAATGSIMKFVLPPGTGHFSTVWGIDRHEWGDIHAWIAATFIAIMAVHLFLNWAWISAVIFGRGAAGSARKTIVWAVAILAIIALAASPFFATVVQTGEPPHRLRTNEPHKNTPLPKAAGHTALTPADSPNGKGKLSSDDHDSHGVKGSMTLQQVEELTGVAAAVIVAELKLPPDTPKTERLGRLKRQHGFEMSDVQNIIEKHRRKTP